MTINLLISNLSSGYSTIISLAKWTFVSIVNYTNVLYPLHALISFALCVSKAIHTIVCQYTPQFYIQFIFASPFNAHNNITARPVSLKCFLTNQLIWCEIILRLFLNTQWYWGNHSHQVKKDSIVWLIAYPWSNIRI